MATKIRLKRIGRRNRPFYRMVAIDARSRRDGAAIEELGWYNPIDIDKSFELKNDRILHWLSEGAQPTEAAKKLLKRSGISHRWHLMKQGLNQSDIDKEMKKWDLNRQEQIKTRKASLTVQADDITSDKPKDIKVKESIDNAKNEDAVAHDDNIDEEE